MMSALPGPFKKYLCTYCHEHMPGLRIKCAECTDFIICLPCFSLGAEIGPHKKDHKYQFEDTGTLTFIGEKGWTANEEMHLLQGIEKHGFGNWESIAAEIKTKTPDEAQEHYFSRFLDGSIGIVTWELACDKRSKLAEKDDAEDDILVSTDNSYLKSDDSGVTLDDINDLGYLLERDEFEKEYDNTAELLLSSLTISPSENSNLEMALILSQVKAYNESLKERIEKKVKVHDYRLIEKFIENERTESSTKKLLIDERNIESLFSGIRNLVPCKEYTEILDRLRRERELKQRVSKLMVYKKHGLTHFDQCVKFDRSQMRKMRRMPKLEPQKSSSEELNQTSPVIRSRASKRSKDKESPFSRGKKQKNSRSVASPQMPTADSSSESKRVVSPLKQATSSLLSETEIELCCDIKLHPSEYLSMKIALLKEGRKSLSVLPKSGRAVYSYLVSNGWLKHNY